MNYYICDHDLKHESQRHECDGCCSQVVLIDKNINVLINKSYEDGVEDERKRVLSFMVGHINVCNYEEVWEEKCDVCVWLEDVVDKILEIEGETN